MMRTSATRTASLYYSELDSPVGQITLAGTKNGLCKVMYGAPDQVLPAMERWAKKFFLNSKAIRDDVAGRDASQQLDEYFQGRRRTFDCQLDVHGTPFQKLVWRHLLEIPYGQVRTYKEVACQIGSPSSVRAVGGANNRNPLPIIIPCHRVIGSNGALVGYGSGLHIKEQLLTLEGYEGYGQKRA